MKGVVFLGDRKLELREFPDPTPGLRDDAHGKFLAQKRTKSARAGNVCFRGEADVDHASTPRQLLTRCWSAPLRVDR